MTQSDLARESDISQPKISKLENGVVPPTPEEITGIARALRYRESLFFRQDGAATIPVTFFRKKASLPALAAKAIIANTTICVRNVAALVRSVNGPTANVPRVDRVDGRPTPSRIARELRVAWRLPRGPIVDLTQTLEDAGVIVVPTDFGVDGIYGLSIHEHRTGLPPIMFVSAQSSADRVRFTMAHELGHMIMHHHIAIPPEQSEDEADEFASEFLMPAEDIRSQLSGLNLERLAQLKAHWRVSMQSLVVRAHALEKISPSQYRRWFQTFNRLGYKLQEPVAIRREEPQSIHDLVRVHLEDLKYSEEQVAEMLDLYVEEFREKYQPRRGGLRLIRST
jgi:Zn-dependent peptidase ImmA (M78 family)